jgi:hypothetical protein
MSPGHDQVWIDMIECININTFPFPCAHDRAYNFSPFDSAKQEALLLGTE